MNILPLLQSQTQAQTTPTSALNMTRAVMAKQLEANYAAKAPTGEIETASGTISLDAMVEAALADSGYGLLIEMNSLSGGQVNSQGVSQMYSSHLKVLTEAYGNATKAPTVIQDV